jgi:predicted RNA polymerase sigma factor
LAGYNRIKTDDALAPEARVALTLRLVCGVPTPEVARAFLVSEPTTEARIPYRVPDRAELPERLDSVLSAVHLRFSTGHTAGEGDALIREELCDRALHVARILAALLPEQARPAACSACCCSPTRVWPPGPLSRAGCSRSAIRAGRAGTSARSWRGSR